MNFFEDEKKLELFEQIQMNLCSLELNTSDFQINKLIEQIPEELLNQKEDLMIICELFAIYARSHSQTKKRNIFKLFEGIMDSIKTYLYDESTFFWKIFGGLFYFKLWFYEIGLISIETIICAAKKDKLHSIAEYFFPEIIEKEPELFENEIKHEIQCSYSHDDIEKFKELRKKHLKWICESGDFKDPLFKEIETDPIRYSILTDDLNLFQGLISNSNFNLNSKIKESLILNSHRRYDEQSLFEFALEYNAVAISKYLILNNVEYTNGIYYSVTTSGNYELIHLIETKYPQNFPEYMIFSTISLWNSDMTEYLLNNYNFDFLEKVDNSNENTQKILNIIQSTFGYVNFEFLRHTILPFLRKNPKFVEDNINEIVNLTFTEKTGFLTKEFVKHPNFDVNFYSEENNQSILGKCILGENLKAIEILLKDPNIDINKHAANEFPPLMVAVGNYSDIKVIDMICNHKDVDINKRDEGYNINSFELSVSRGNIYSCKYFIDNIQNLDVNSFGCLFFFTLKSRYLSTLRVVLNYYLNLNKKEEYENIVSQIKVFSFINEYKEEYLDDFKQVYDELTHNSSAD